MKIRWELASRVPRPPVWAAALVSFWLLLVFGGVLLEWQGAPAFETCLLHRVTGHPCPTCGSTRMVLHLLRGHGLQALVANPLMAVGLLGLGLWLVLRLAFGRQLVVDLSPGERKAALILGLLTLAANWAWLLATQA